MPRSRRHRRRYRARPERPFTSAQETFARCEAGHVLEVRNPAGIVGQTERTYNLLFKWQQPDGADPTATDYFGFDSGAASNRFLDMRPNWQQFAITGLRIEWFPSSIRASYGDNRDLQIASVWTWAGQNYDNIGAITNGDVIQADSAKFESGLSYFKRYYDMRAYSNS